MRVQFKIAWLLFIFCFLIYFPNAFSASDSISVEAHAGNFPVYPTPNYGSGSQRKLIERGEYLTKAGDCIACHTNTPEGGKPFAGGLPLATPFGTFYSPNITSDKETGIGKWSDQDFIRAMHDGISPSGSNYFPVFPYVYFNKVTPQDLLAIKAYLFSIPAVHLENKSPDVPWPFNVRLAQWGWKLMFFYPYKGPLNYDLDKSQAWNRGQYLVEGLGHCAMCHTPLNPLGAPKRSQHLTGTFINGFWAPNITGYGLKGASNLEVVNVFMRGELIHGAGRVAGPMAEVDHNSLSYLSTKDLAAIVEYLKSLKSVETLGVKGEQKQRTLARGKKVYNSACLICHNQGQAGAPRIGDAGNWSQRITQGEDILYKHAINGFNNMPPRGACVTCSDQDVMAAVDYIINESLSSKDLALIAEPPAVKLSIEDGKQIYEQHCAECHQAGRLGAPITGDKEVWKPLIEKNMEVLYLNTLNGLRKMPVMGGCDACSRAEVMAAVRYMVQESSTQGDYNLW